MTIPASMDKIVELNIKDFRAVKDADIALNGITVVTGINGCGKSTMSKFLYYALKYANDYDGLVNEDLRARMGVLTNLLQTINQDVYKFSGDFDLSLNWHGITPDDKDIFMSSFTKMKETLQKAYQNTSDRVEVSKKRVLNVLSSTLEVEKESLSELLDVLYDRMEEAFRVSSKLKKDRAYILLSEKLKKVWKGNDLKNISLKEYGEQIIGKEVSITPIPHFVQKVVYIDTPIIVGEPIGPFEINSQWKDLNILLRRKVESQYSKEIDNIIKNEILHGDASVVEDAYGRREIVYNRSDGKQFNLLDCATGIKSFSILQLLIKNGFIDKHTLVILDEPEAHLHPQWIVEYARMVVMIHKVIGTKFFIASHSTDMVSAIRYIAEKEQCLKPLSFYLAEEDEDNPNQYIYKDLHTNIEPIFDSFNKSFDKIEQYGESKGYSTEEDLL